MENNLAITGDQARLLIFLMTQENVSYKGGQLIGLYHLLQQLIAINNVQPAQESASNEV